MKKEENKKQEKLNNEQLNEINGGFLWDKVKEQAKKAAKETTDTGNLSLY